MEEVQMTTEDKIKAKQLEYHQQCLRVGDLSYQIDCLQAEIGRCHVTMRNINHEGDKLQKLTAKEPNETNE